MYAAIVTPGTALAGWLWRQEIGNGLPFETVERHQHAGVVLAIALIALAGWRSRIHVRDQRPGRIYFIAALAAIAALVYQGILGGRLVFG